MIADLGLDGTQIIRVIMMGMDAWLLIGVGWNADHQDCYDSMDAWLLIGVGWNADHQDSYDGHGCMAADLGLDGTQIIRIVMIAWMHGC